MAEDFDITGRWKFREDFGFGTDSGYAQLIQKGVLINGIFQFAEQIEGEETFIVKQEVSGRLEGNKISLKAHSCEILFSEDDIVYELDAWEGEIMQDGRIEGSSKDSEGTGGAFKMERESYETSNLTDTRFVGLN